MSENSHSFALGSHIGAIAAMRRASTLTRTDTCLDTQCERKGARAVHVLDTGKFTFETSRYMQYAFAGIMKVQGRKYDARDPVLKEKKLNNRT